MSKNDFLQGIIEAHGGMDRWMGFTTFSAHLSQGGIIWPLKGNGGVLDEVDVHIKLHEPWTSHHPFGAEERRTMVTPERAVIEDMNGKVLETTSAPRASFAGHQLDTPWSKLQLAYFVGYAIWNYFTMPFTLATPGFELAELPTWKEDGQIWRRLQVTFPSNLATHSKVQTFYFSDDGMLRRHDYEVEISGGAPAVHYLSEHVSVQGIAVPTKHMIYVRETSGGHQPEPVVVSIHASKIRFA